MNKWLKPAVVAGSLLFLAGCGAAALPLAPITIHSLPESAPSAYTVQNEHLRLEFLTDSAEIVVTQLSTGHEWRSTPYDAANDTEANFITRVHMQSLFLLEFENEQGIGRTFDNFRYAGDSFNITEIPNGIEVEFTVGEVPEFFMMPEAVPATRMRYFLDQMAFMQRLMIESAFREINLNQLLPTDDRDELLERFPTLTEENVWIRRENVPTHLLATAENYFIYFGYTMEDYYADLEWFGLAEASDSIMFNLTMRFELDGNSMVVSVPFDEIRRPYGTFPVELTIMPFFGAGRPDLHQGYVFVPDGSGALIHFDSTRHNQQIYHNNVWGWDAAVSRNIVIHDNIANYPVWGSYKNGQTFLAIIEEGASYGAIRAQLSGMFGPYTTAYSRFRLMHGASLNIAGRSDRPFLIHERGLAEGEQIAIRYVFPEGGRSGYVGMAHAYREYLQARYPWLNQRLDTPVLAAVEMLGAAEIVQHVLGFPVDRPLPLTTYDQAADIINQLSARGWRDVPVKMRGAHNNSIDHAVPSSVSLISQLGGRSGFNNMLGAANNAGFDFFLEGDFVHMRDITLFDGFNASRDASRFVNRERVEHLGHSPIYFAEQHGQSLFADHTTLARPSVTVNMVNNFVGSAASHGVHNIAFRSLAGSLGGDFHEDRHVSREAAMHMRVDLLQDLSNRGVGIWLNQGFSYGAPFADMISNLPLSDQNFGITDTVVPFFQIALHGLVNFAGAPLNLSEDYSYELLRSVESGAALFFSFMHEPTSALLDTAYRRYFANEFGRWVNVADQLYHNHVNNFGHLYNQLIDNHEILATGVTRTTFEDGTRVYVNTSEQDFNAGGVSVDSRRYVVVRGSALATANATVQNRG